MVLKDSFVEAPTFLGYYLTVFEDGKGGNAKHVVFLCKLAVFIDVDLDKIHLAIVFS